MFPFTGLRKKRQIFTLLFINFADHIENEMENKTYVLVKPEQAANKNVLTNEWICRKKAGKNGCIVYKARLVVKGYKQVYGVDYFDIANYTINPHGGVIAAQVNCSASASGEWE